MRTQKKVEVIEKPKYIEKIVEVPKEGLDEEGAEKIETLLEIAERVFTRRLQPYLYTIWKLSFQLSALAEEHGEVRAELEKKTRVLAPREGENAEFFSLTGTHFMKIF